jgi:hypothetical protein
VLLSVLTMVARSIFFKAFFTHALFSPWKLFCWPSFLSRRYFLLFCYRCEMGCWLVGLLPVGTFNLFHSIQIYICLFVFWFIVLSHVPVSCSFPSHGYLMPLFTHFFSSVIMFQWIQLQN